MDIEIVVIALQILNLGFVGGIFYKMGSLEANQRNIKEDQDDLKSRVKKIEHINREVINHVA